MVSYCLQYISLASALGEEYESGVLKNPIKHVVIMSHKYVINQKYIVLL